jgi:hypothetical protein
VFDDQDVEGVSAEVETVLAPGGAEPALVFGAGFGGPIEQKDLARLLVVP